jgi:predicted ATPase
MWRRRALRRLGAAYHYRPRIFMAPPWPAIYATNADRRHSFDEAVAEYHRPCGAYDSLGYDMAMLPLTDVAARAQWLLSRLGSLPSDAQTR